MKAALIRRHGGLECLEIAEAPEPVAGEWEAVLEVRAAALNHLDIWVRGGRGAPTMTMPHVLGSDAAGVVVALGPSVHGLKEGDEVVLYPGLSCGCCEHCLRGEQSECLSFGIIGLSRPGTFARRVAVPAANLRPKPGHLNFVEAAALPLAHVTAWRMLMTRARLRPGELVLIHGIGGGVALAALQLARLVGAEVIVTSSSDRKLASAAALGAQHTINYRTASAAGGTSGGGLTKAVRDLTGGRGVDLVFDTVGAATFPIDLALLRRGGRMVLCGVTGGGEAPADLRAIYWNQLTILGSTLGSYDDFRAMLRAVAVNGIKPVIDSVLPLERAREAMGRMESGEQFGKIVLEVAP